VTDRLSELRNTLLILLGAVVATLVITLLLVPNKEGGRGVPTAILFQGLVQGLIAAVLAAGLVLIFRTSRIINFAAIALGAPGGLLAFELIRFTSCPFPLALLMGLVVSGAMGALAELSFGRRFAKRSRLIFTIATIFIAQALVRVVTPAVLNAPFLPDAELRPQSALAASDALNPYLPFAGFDFPIGGFPVKFGFPELFVIEAVLVTLVVLGIILRYSRLGVALRSVAANTERAAMLGISTGGITTMAWVIAGLLGGVAVILTGINGNAGRIGPDGGASTLFLPLTAAVLARFRSVPVAALACVLMSVITSALNFGLTDPQPIITGGQLLLLVGGLLLQRRDLFRLASAGEGSWRLSAEERPVPREMAELAGYRALRYLAIAVAAVAVLVIPFVTNAGTVSKFQGIFLLGVIGLSLVILTGWAGQVSLGQYAFVAVGAVVAGGSTTNFDVPFLLAVPLGTIVAAGVAMLIGLPALRVKGLFLGVATFGLAVATSVLLFDENLFGWLLPTAIPRPKIFVDFDGEKQFYFLCLAAFAGSLVFVRNLRSSRFGRLLIASRDNDAALQSAGVSIIKTRLQAFAISGGLAGFGGAMLAFQLRTVTVAGFDAQASFLLFIYVVLGGVSSIAGALIGVAYLGYTNNFLSNGPIITYVTQSLPIFILYFAPGGLLAVFTNVRDGVLRIVAQRRGMVVPALFRGVDAATLANRLTPLSEPLPSAGLAALPREARWSIGSRMHGQPGHVLSAEDSMDEGQLFAAASASMDAHDEQSAQTTAPPTPEADLVGTTGARA
jgi:branched-chain amino acid transport system permease protein